MITFKVEGNFNNAKKFLHTSLAPKYVKLLEMYGREGVDALSAATPLGSGLTATSWEFEITQEKGKVELSWKNTNVVDGVNIAVILQYGHGTRNGGYVRGIDYINPALEPIFRRITEEAWKAVTSS